MSEELETMGPDSVSITAPPVAPGLAQGAVTYQIRDVSGDVVAWTPPDEEALARLLESAVAPKVTVTNPGISGQPVANWMKGNK